MKSPRLPPCTFVFASVLFSHHVLFVRSHHIQLTTKHVVFRQSLLRVPGPSRPSLSTSQQKVQLLWDEFFSEYSNTHTWQLAVCNLSVNNCQASDDPPTPFALQLCAGSKGVTYGYETFQLLGGHVIDTAACKDAERTHTTHQTFALKAGTTPSYLTGLVFGELW